MEPTILTDASDRFDIQSLISQGWDAFVKQWMAWIGIVIAYFVIIFATSYVATFFGPSLIGAILRLLLVTLVSIFGQVFFIKAALASLRGEIISLNLLTEIRLATAVNLLVGSLLFSIAVYVGFLLLIVPGIYISLTYGYFLYYIIDKDMGFMEAFQMSGQATKGFRLSIFMMQIVLGLVVVIGLLALGVGLFVAFPVSLIAQAASYVFLDRVVEGPANTSLPPSTSETPEIMVSEPIA